MTLSPLDKDAFRRVLALTRKFCRNGGIDHEAIVQNILLEHLSNHKLITSTAVKHRCYDALRQLKTDREHEIAYASSDRTQPVPFDYTELDALLGGTELSQHERTVTLLYFMHGLSLREISQSLNLPVRQVSDMQWRGLEKLKETARRLYHGK